MSFIDRENGKITGVYARPQIEGQEQIDENDDELLAFLNPPPAPMAQLEAIITQTQLAMTDTPLPDDIQKQIFDLEVFVQNYYRRGAYDLITETINGFVIPDDDARVSQDQRAGVNAAKALMLAVFNGL